MTQLRFDGRVAAVTGVGRGVGRSHAMLLVQKGARVVVADYGVGINGSGSSPAPADEVVREIIGSGGQAVACYASVADHQGAQAIVDTAVERFGRLDVLINNAGIHDPGLFEALSVEQFRSMLDVHFYGSLLVSRAAMRTAGIMKTPLTAEDIAENLEEIMNVSDAQVTAVTEMVQ